MTTTAQKIKDLHALIDRALDTKQVTRDTAEQLTIHINAISADMQRVTQSPERHAIAFIVDEIEKWNAGKTHNIGDAFAECVRVLDAEELIQNAQEAIQTANKRDY